MFPGDVCLEHGLSISSQQGYWEAGYGGGGIRVALSTDTATGRPAMGVAASGSPLAQILLLGGQLWGWQHLGRP